MRFLSFLGAVLVAVLLLIFVSTWGMSNLRQAFCFGPMEKIIWTAAGLAGAFIITFFLFFLFFNGVVLHRKKFTAGMFFLSLFCALLGSAGIVYFSQQLALQTCAAPEIYRSLVGVCQGRGNDQAGKFTPGIGSPNHLVVLYTDGIIHPWSAIVSKTWRPQSLADTELVLCVSKPTNLLAEACIGVADRNVTRYQEQVTASIVDPHSAKVIASSTFIGELPSCEGIERNLVSQLIGKVELSTVEEWVRGALPQRQLESSTDTPQIIKTVTPTITKKAITPTSTRRSATATVPLVAIVRPATARVRKGPGVEYGLLGGLQQDDQVRILGRNEASDWIKIVMPDGKEGWISAELLKIPVPIGNLLVVK
jgi:hypothetical protein